MTQPNPPTSETLAGPMSLPLAAAGAVQAADALILDQLFTTTATPRPGFHFAGFWPTGILSGWPQPSPPPERGQMSSASTFARPCSGLTRRPGFGRHIGRHRGAGAPQFFEQRQRLRIVLLELRRTNG